VRSRPALAVAVVLVAVAVAAGAFVASRDDGEAEGSGVPAVVGLDEERAEAELVERGYSTQVVRRRDAKPAGTVVVQQPPGGRAAATGSVVVLVVSAGPGSGAETPPDTQSRERVTVPDVTATHQILAGATLEGRGLVADSVPIANGADCGVVIRQEPAAGTLLQAGAHVRLVVSLGRDPRPLAQVPGLSGAAAAARTAAREFGFTVRTVEQPAESPEDVGVVLRQVPSALTRSRELTQITLFVGR
jgi:serine/threonine-protein kinase